MPGHVRERLLRGPQQRDLDVRRHGSQDPGGGDLRGHAVQRGPPPRHLAQRLAEPGGLQRLGTQLVHRTPGLGQALAGQPDRCLDAPVPVRLPAGLRGRLQLGDDPGEALRQGVVDLARHPLPLVHDPGLPRLGEQLLVQARVLGQRGLELAVGHAQLGQRLLAPLVPLVAHRREPGEANGHRDVEEQQDAVEQALLRAVRQAAVL